MILFFPFHLEIAEILLNSEFSFCQTKRNPGILVQSLRSTYRSVSRAVITTHPETATGWYGSGAKAGHLLKNNSLRVKVEIWHSKCTIQEKWQMSRK